MQTERIPEKGVFLIFLARIYHNCVDFDAQLNFSRFFNKKLSDLFAGSEKSYTFALAFGKQRGNAVSVPASTIDP